MRFECHRESALGSPHNAADSRDCAYQRRDAAAEQWPHCIAVGTAQERETRRLELLLSAKDLTNACHPIAEIEERLEDSPRRPGVTKTFYAREAILGIP